MARKSIRLSKSQRTIVNFGDGALLVVAGPGSGKTRVLTERVRKLLGETDEHFRILAVTFTNKAANEMMERLSDVPDLRQKAFVGTLHSFCMEVLSNRGAAVGIREMPHIFEQYDDRMEILRSAVSTDPTLRAEVRRHAANRKEADKLLGRWLREIGRLKNRLESASMASDEATRIAYEVYDSELRANGAVDYDDLLLLTYRLFTERPKVAGFYRRLYRYVCIDEGQDLNKAQYQLLRSLCGREHQNVMVVGDPKQAIFVWNGGDPKYLDLFVEDFNAETITLNENFRSSRAVVEAAALLAPEYEVEGELAIEGEVCLTVAQDENDESDMLFERLSALLSSGHPDIEGSVSLESCAIIGRSRYVFGAIEGRFEHEGVPYYRPSTAEGLSESDLLIQFELGARLIANPRDRLHLNVLLSAWDVDIEQQSYRDFESSEEIHGYLGGLDTHARNHEVVIDCLANLLERPDSIPMPSVFELIEARLDKEVGIEDEERALVQQDLAAWRKHWDMYARASVGGSQTIGGFLSQIALGATQAPREEGIALLTVHAAKGLEFDVVFIVGMSEGTFPDYRADGETMDEERRNAFVSVTRSKRLLYLSYPESKVMPWGDARRQTPSRFLNELGLL